jgi:ornithine cyclodeaminase/alanine dehydrogenase-like protein (mu-crystallin family)
MLVLDADTVARNLDYDRLIPALKKGLAKETTAPQRIHHPLADKGSMLLMPAWNASHLGLKMVNIIPANTAHGRSPISSAYLLCDTATGEITALLDGATLTTRRTAALTALAASFLAAQDADDLLLVGAGRVARQLPNAIAAVRPIKRVTVWARNNDRACALAREIETDGFDCVPCANLEKSAMTARIIACATFSTQPIIKGDWLDHNPFVSLIGGFRPDMREADSEAIRRSYVVADTRSGVLEEAGDIITPIAEHVIGKDHIRDDLFDLCRADGYNVERRTQPVIFKSVGHAAQDLAAAALCMESYCAA